MGELQQFVAELLEEHGAVVEPVDPEGLDVLAPRRCSELLMCRRLPASASPPSCRPMPGASGWSRTGLTAWGGCSVTMAGMPAWSPHRRCRR